MSKNRYYVVWQGKVTGVLTSWEACQESIKGHPFPKYKAYKDIAEAHKAFDEGWKTHWGKDTKGSKFYTEEELKVIGVPKTPSICVNSSCDMVTRIMTYKGVDTLSAKELFRQGPFLDCDQHVGEFLALVHGLAYLHQQGSVIPVYSRSRHAMQWVGGKHYGGQLHYTDNNKKVHDLIRRAEKWLSEHRYENEVLLWNKRAWNYPGNLSIPHPEL